MCALQTEFKVKTHDQSTENKWTNKSEECLNLIPEFNISSAQRTCWMPAFMCDLNWAVMISVSDRSYFVIFLSFDRAEKCKVCDIHLKVKDGQQLEIDRETSDNTSEILMFRCEVEHLLYDDIWQPDTRPNSSSLYMHTHTRTHLLPSLKKLFEKSVILFLAVFSPRRFTKIKATTAKKHKNKHIIQKVTQKQGELWAAEDANVISSGF